MSTHAEPFPAGRASSRTWAIVGVVVLLFAALGAGVLIGRATVEEAAPPAEALGLASTEVVGVLDAGITAWNSLDTEAVARFYSEDAVLDDLIAGEVSEGIGPITEKITRFGPSDPWGIERVSEVVQTGDFAAYAFTYSRPGEGIAIFELDPDLRVVHQWVMGV